MKRFKIDFSFILLLGIIALSPKQFIILKLLFCLLIHELGHLFFVFLFHYKIDSLKLSLFGFFLKLTPTRTECINDIFLYLGGILFNAICFFIIPDPTIKKISLLLILFNSLPVYPLDGFNTLQSLFSYFFPYRIVLKVMGIFGMLFSLAFVLCCVGFKMDVFVICNAFYLFFYSLSYYFQEGIYFQKFMLEKTLHPFSYPLKSISFRERIEYCFYKYHTIQMKVGNKIISEEELFQLKSRFK